MKGLMYFLNLDKEYHLFYLNYEIGKTRENQNTDESDMTTVKFIEISSEPVELHKILKFEGITSSGGEAKSVIAEGLVKVNGSVETRKRRKIVSGDIIEFGNQKMCVQLKET